MRKDPRRPSPEKEDVRACVLRRLAEGYRPPRGRQKDVASSFGVTPRTFRNWRALVERSAKPRRRGRKPTPPEEIERVRALVETALKEIGWTAGEDTLKRALDQAGKKASRRVIRTVLRELKASRRQRIGEEAAARRQTLTVTMRDAVWAQDGAELERNADGVVSTEVIRELATASIEGVAPHEDAPSTDDVIDAFEAAAKARGGYPLICSTDNGSVYASKRFKKHLRKRGVVHLKNLPRTPQHNAFAERAVRELKEEALWCQRASSLAVPTPGSRASATEAWSAILDTARGRLRQRPRASRHGLSSQQLDTELPKAYDRVDRRVFYAAVQEALAAARRAHRKPRARRLAERAAILDTAVHFGLIEVHRGGVRLHRVKAENNS